MRSIFVTINMNNQLIISNLVKGKDTNNITYMLLSSITRNNREVVVYGSKHPLTREDFHCKMSPESRLLHPIGYYYRFIVRFPIGLDFLFITFTILLHLLLSWTSIYFYHGHPFTSIMDIHLLLSWIFYLYHGHGHMHLVEEKS